jgi:hypothetical protein
LIARAILAAALLLPGTAPAADPSPEATVAAYRQRVTLLQDQDAIENLQGLYGYYFDKALWDRVAGLFAADATFEHGQSGVYVGRGHIRRALDLFGPAGPQPKRLNNYLQLQPVIHVAPDGRTARARWRAILQTSAPDANGEWGEGTYENSYVKEGGRWRIKSLHFYVTALADYDLGFGKGPIPMAGPSTILPPDRPPTEIYRALPGAYVPPFHYAHPVTGALIDTSVPPPDSVLGRTGKKP